MTTMKNETPEELRQRVLANRQRASNSTTATLRTASGTRTPHTRAAVEAAIRSLGRDPNDYRMESASMLHVMAGGRVPGSDVDAVAEALGNPADAPALRYRAATTTPTTDDQRSTSSGVRHSAPAAGPNDAPPPPDIVGKIRANRRRERPEIEREAARVAGVRTLLRPNGPLPVRDDATMALPEPLVTAAAADQHAAPPPPDLGERIRQKRGVK
jgi:hypothetical protein